MITSSKSAFSEKHEHFNFLLARTFLTILILRSPAVTILITNLGVQQIEILPSKCVFVTWRTLNGCISWQVLNICSSVNSIIILSPPKTHTHTLYKTKILDGRITHPLVRGEAPRWLWLQRSDTQLNEVTKSGRQPQWGLDATNGQNDWPCVQNDLNGACCRIMK